MPVWSVTSVLSNSLQPRGLQPTRLLGPWDSPGKSTGVGVRFLIQGIFLDQGLKLHPLQLDILMKKNEFGPLTVII